ncbi:MAG: hypothetical protein K0R24_592 [Gammaproteobacteria bacterium]|jgi:hypothetical protein|nr:hypothetical protein [Gammaproteobacteria bacterium]
MVFFLIEQELERVVMRGFLADVIEIEFCG